MPGKDIPEIRFFDFLPIDKLAHVFMYALLVFLTVTGLKRQYSNGWLRYYAKSTAFWIGMFYGLFMEIIQLLVNTGRQFELEDIVANSLGCCIGIGSFIIIYGKELSK
jgi:VanZ family protein